MDEYYNQSAHQFIYTGFQTAYQKRHIYSRCGCSITSRCCNTWHGQRIVEVGGPVVKGLKGPALPTPVLAPWSLMVGFAGPFHSHFHRGINQYQSYKGPYPMPEGLIGTETKWKSKKHILPPEQWSDEKKTKNHHLKQAIERHKALNWCNGDPGPQHDAAWWLSSARHRCQRTLGRMWCCDPRPPKKTWGSLRIIATCCHHSVSFRIRAVSILDLAGDISGQDSEDLKTLEDKRKHLLSCQMWIPACLRCRVYLGLAAF